MMAGRSAAFVTLPGGIGTFEEFFETLSWAMLGLHHKAMGVLNIAGYFDPLIALLDHAVSQQFVKARAPPASGTFGQTPKRWSWR